MAFAIIHSCIASLMYLNRVRCDFFFWYMAVVVLFENLYLRNYLSLPALLMVLMMLNVCTLWRSTVWCVYVRARV
jgi:hypothetical protein